jgi:8-oxo-dGTP pyrophosphatase MutT (NUDIX family)
VTWKTVNEGIRSFSTGWVTTSVDLVDPGTGVPVEYTRIRAGDFVVVFPQFTNGDILLLYEYRHGPREKTISLPTGKIEKGESPHEAAVRELREETGCVASELCSLLPRPLCLDGNYGIAKMHLYAAAGVKRQFAVTDDDLESRVMLRATREDLREILSLGLVKILAHYTCMLIGLDKMSL